MKRILAWALFFVLLSGSAHAGLKAVTNSGLASTGTGGSSLTVTTTNTIGLGYPLYVTSTGTVTNAYVDTTSPFSYNNGTLNALSLTVSGNAALNGTTTANNLTVTGTTNLSGALNFGLATGPQGNGAIVGQNPIAGAAAEYPLLEGSGTTVNDISGNNNTATLSGSTGWNSYGVTFSSGSYGWIATPIKTWKTLFLHVCNISPVAGASNIPYATYPTLGGTASGGGVTLFGQISNSFTGLAALYPSINHSGSYTTTTNTNASACGVIAYVLGSSDHIYVNGVESSYGTQGVSSGNVTTTGSGYNLGSDGTSSSGKQYAGNIDYAVFYTSTFTTAQVQTETSYITSKVASRSGFPLFPGTSAQNNPQLACLGDSLTIGFNGTGTWCNSTYTITNNTYAYNVEATGGDAAANEVSLMYRSWTPAISVNAARNICHVWIGTNDVSQYGWSAAATWAHLQQIGTQLKNLNCVPIVATMISRGGEDTLKNSLNALIRSNWKTSFAALDDLAAIPGLGADGASANPSVTCFNADGIHLNGPAGGSPACYNSLYGYGVIGWNVARIINTLDGSTIDSPTVTTSNSYTQNIGDNYVLQTPSASATTTLPDCTGLTSIQRTIINGSSAYSITVRTSASQTITGSSVIPPLATGVFTCLLTAASTGGNYWTSSVQNSAQTSAYTVSTLPSGVTGMRAYVTDQTSACPLVGGALTGSGAITCPVFYNGSAWVGD